MTCVVGVDPSLTATGVATGDGATTVATAAAGKQLSARAARIARIVQLLEVAIELAQPLPAGPVLVVVEGPSFGQLRQAGEHQRAGLWWAIAASLLAAGHQVVEVPPATLKKAATGKGNATKADMRVAWLQRAGEDLRDDNQVDAQWLRQVGLHLVSDAAAIPLPAPQRAAIESLRVQLPAR